MTLEWYSIEKKSGLPEFGYYYSNQYDFIGFEVWISFFSINYF